jgi:predicted enzyme related to lactoylglutathione lyase
MFMRIRRVPVKNRERAIAFYSALPGVDIGQSDALAFEERDNTVAGLLRFDVANRLDEALAFVWSNGGRVLEPEPTAGGSDRCALVLDCEGNRIALYASDA